MLCNKNEANLFFSLNFVVAVPFGIRQIRRVYRHSGETALPDGHKKGSAMGKQAFMD